MNAQLRSRPNTHILIKKSRSYQITHDLKNNLLRICVKKLWLYLLNSILHVDRSFQARLMRLLLLNWHGSTLTATSHTYTPVCALTRILNLHPSRTRTNVQLPFSAQYLTALSRVTTPVSQTTQLRLRDLLTQLPQHYLRWSRWWTAITRWFLLKISFIDPEGYWKINGAIVIKVMSDFWKNLE